MKTPIKTFGKRIKEIRKRLGLSQRELAKMLDLDPAVISKYEREKITPGEGIIRQVAQRLSVSADYLLGLTNEPMLKNNSEHLKKQLERLKELEKERKELLRLVEHMRQILSRK